MRLRFRMTVFPISGEPAASAPDSPAFAAAAGPLIWVEVASWKKTLAGLLRLSETGLFEAGAFAGLIPTELGAGWMNVTFFPGETRYAMSELSASAVPEI